MKQQFLRLEQGGDVGALSLFVDESLCVGPKGNAFLFGGVGLGSAIRAAEHATGRHVIWASAQFLSYARVEDRLDLVVATLNQGRNVSQVEVRASVAGTLILSVRAALGSRGEMPEDQWVEPPTMPVPDRCCPIAVWPPQDERARFMDRIEVRLDPDAAASSNRGERSADGRRTMWMKMRGDVQVDASVLAAFADFVPSGIAAAFGRPGGGNSLDNTLRICRIVPTDWVLCEVRVSAAVRGFGHGAVSLFAQDGTLLATGSQSVIMRFLQAAQN